MTGKALQKTGAALSTVEGFIMAEAGKMGEIV
jgi:hypothetical protein